MNTKLDCLSAARIRLLASSSPMSPPTCLITTDENVHVNIIFGSVGNSRSHFVCLSVLPKFVKVSQCSSLYLSSLLVLSLSNQHY